MRIALTGASGFVGLHVLQLLSALGEVHAVARKRVAAEGVTWHECDLFDEKSMRVAMKDIRATHLVHLAWYTSPNDFWTAQQNATWFEASVRLAEAFIENGGAHMIAAGSCAEYLWSGERCREDSTPLADATPYAASKNALHAACAALCADSGVRLAWGRVFYVYGAGEHPQRFLSAAARAMRRGETLTIREPQRSLDYVNVSDVARAFSLLASSSASGAFNIGTGQGRTVRSMVEVLARVGTCTPMVQVEMPAVQGPDVIADIEKMRALGWHPVVPFESGVAHLWHSVGSNESR